MSMELPTEQTDLIIRAIIKCRDNFGGVDKKYAEFLGIHSTQLSQLLNGKRDKLVSGQKLLSIGRLLEVNLRPEREWVTVETPVFIHISTQLDFCRTNSASGLMVDDADIGKSHTARHYAATHKHTVHIDCAQYKSKTRLIRAIARAFGVDSTGGVHKVYDELVYYIRSLNVPVLIILDEAGDLSYEAWLEIKALWNATEGCCGWYMMGADGLKQKIDNNLGNKKVGYTEIFSRLGNQYQKVTDDTELENKLFKEKQAALIIRANAPSANINTILKKTGGSLRRIRLELSKAA